MIHPSVWLLRLSLIAWFVACLILLIMALQSVGRSRRLLAARLATYFPSTPASRPASVSSSNYPEPSPADTSRTGRPAGPWHRQVLQSMTGLSLLKPYRTRLDLDLDRAGWPWKHEEFFSLVLAGMLLVGGFALLIPGLRPLSIFFTVAGAVLPHLILRYAGRKRAYRFSTQMGDILLILRNSLQAGHSFLQSLQSMTGELPSPAAEEFQRLSRQLSLGMPIEEALRNMAARLQSRELDLLVTAILVQRQVGGNLVEILEKIERTLQERIRLRRQLRAATAQGRMTAWVISLLPPGFALFLALTDPAMFGVLLHEPLGRLLLLTAVTLELVGVLIVRKLVSTEGMQA